jgi:glycosyltransferase involved in cell wall biosynthesis
MKITILVPCYNEEPFIRELLGWVEKKCDYDYEVLVIDGGSTDKTLAYINNFISGNNRIRLISNPNKYVSHALNKGIGEAIGEFIIRLDVHVLYPDDYFSRCIKILTETHADNVGGFLEYIGTDNFSKGIAASLSSFWGIGYNTIGSIRFDHYTDTVFFGFWHKKTFEKFGLFDEELVRNQDEEFNYRIIKSGGKIFKSADILLHKYVRNDLSSLFIQYFEYGFYKPLVIKKIGHIIKIRHVIPSVFVLYIIFLFFLPIGSLFLLPLLCYMGMSLYWAINQNNPFVSKLVSFIAFPVIHIAYGSGFLAGIIRTLR